MGTDNAPRQQNYIDCNGVLRADNWTGARFNPGEKVAFLLAGGKYEEGEVAVQHAERTLVRWKTNGLPTAGWLRTEELRKVESRG